MENEICHLKLEDIIPKTQRPYDKNYDYIEQELVDSIKKHGIIQPIIVKKTNDKYLIIDGNRRYFAALKAGLTKIPVFIRNDVESVIKIDLNDNLYNHELSPIDEAKKYKEILETSNMTQEELANNLGKSQSALANKLRLLNLPVEIQDALDNYEISERHARSLLTVKNKEMQLNLLEKIKKEKITVRELDSEIKNMSNMFIPEEFSNKNSNSNLNQNYNENNMFISNENINNNFTNTNAIDNNNMFIQQDNNFNNVANNNVVNNNIDSTQLDLPNNNGGMNPFLTSNNYIPPMPENNIQNNNINDNPFSNIRMNTNNMINDNNNNNNNNNNLFFTSNNDNKLNEDSNSFNIDDYKLPEYDNNDYNQENSVNMENSAPIEPAVVNIPNDYKYVEDNPNYVSVDKPDGVSSVDDVINVLKVALEKIKNGKIRVDTEEIDYDDTYQITIRIDKKGDFL